MSVETEAAENLVKFMTDAGLQVFRIVGNFSKGSAKFIGQIILRHMTEKGKPGLLYEMLGGKEPTMIATIADKDLNKFKEFAKKTEMQFSLIPDKDLTDGKRSVKIFAKDANTFQWIVDRAGINVIEHGKVTNETPEQEKEEREPDREKENRKPDLSDDGDVIDFGNTVVGIEPERTRGKEENPTVEMPGKENSTLTGISKTDGNSTEISGATGRTDGKPAGKPELEKLKDGERVNIHDALKEATDAVKDVGKTIAPSKNNIER